MRACCDDVGGVWHVAAVALRSVAYNPPSTHHLGNNVQNVCDVRDERMRAYACAHVAMMSVGYGM